jgi:pseudouridine kinase
VDTSGVRLVPGATTGQYVALLGPDGDLLYAAAAMDVLDGIGPPDVDRGWRDPDWLFLDCNLPAPTLAYSLDRARRAGVPVAVDAVSTPKVQRLPRDLGGVTVFFCNQAEALAWLGLSAVESPARLTVLLRAAGAAAVVMSRGERGVLVDDDHVPALPADVRDVTGAGDALVAGTLAGLLAGRGLRSAVAAGTAAAALTVESEHTVRPDLTAAMIARRLGNGDPGPPDR